MAEWQPLPVVPDVGPPVLEYQRPDAGGQFLRSRRARVGFFLVSLAAAASVFLPFTFGTSPAQVLAEWATHGVFAEGSLLPIALPFLSGVLIAVCNLRRLLGFPCHRVERGLRFAVAVACMALTLYLCGRVLAEGNIRPIEIAQIMLGPAVLAAGAIVVAWWLRHGPQDEAGMLALYTGYAGNAVILLVIMPSPDHLGWWATLVAVVGMGVEAFLVVRASRPRWG